VTGEERLLDKVAELRRELAESVQRQADLCETIARRDARIRSLERQRFDLLTRPATVVERILHVEAPRRRWWQR
jgi:hypothetical protein